MDNPNSSSSDMNPQNNPPGSTNNIFADDQQSCPPSSICSVISPQFCAAENDVYLTITEDDDDDKLVSVKDAEGEIVFHIKDDKHTIVHKHRRFLLDVAGNPLVTMQRKRTMTHNKRWKVYKGDSSSKDYLLFTARQPSSIKDFPTKLLDVFLATNAKEKEKNACSDVTVIGSWVERSCTFYACTTKYSNSPAIIAQMSKKQKVIGSEQMLGDEEEYRKDMSTVTVYPKIDYAFIVALIVILDTIHDDDKSLGKKESRADAMNFATSAVSLADATLSVVANIFPAN